ncbi:hypothetical protein QUF54_03555 [Candidatus Marithioploca araucensis]|uniref:Uncharacterized protein n=1 Tax=Candidatus Marithioploca araucensis TaxID=70273 RepID=A0ABT7VRW0_9GAMM|nr:hypothetical protein [Candidatus Marithioploca araucensis]
MQNGKFLFRGDDSYKGGDIGMPIRFDVDAIDIINHIRQKKTGNPYVSFSTKQAKGTGDSRGAGFFGQKILKVSTDDLKSLIDSGAVKIIIPDDAYNIISLHPKKKISRDAGNIRRIMQRNNERLIQGQIPSSIIQR